LDKAPVEPDLVRPWTRSVWLYGLRAPFSLIFLGWITLAQSLSPSFNVEIYLYSLLASLLGLVVGAHYIDISTSETKFSPFFRIPRRLMLVVGIIGVVLGGLVGVYMALRWNVAFLIFVAIESVAAVAYPRERPRFTHNYISFGLTWGAIPFAASYFIQSGSLNPVSIGLATFVGISVVMMHHLAIMSRESPSWKDALYLLRLYRYSVYIMSVLAILGRLIA
jgi:hypothetical protein